MGRLIQVILIVQFTTTVFSQVFVKGSRPYIVLPSDPEESPYYDPNPSPPDLMGFQARSGAPAGQSNDKTAEHEEEIEEFIRNPRFPPRLAKAEIEEEEEEEQDQEDDEEISPDEYESLTQKLGKENVDKIVKEEGRFLWPFHVSISKGKGKHSYQPGYNQNHAKHETFGLNIQNPSGWTNFATTMNPVLEDLKSLTKKEIELLNSEAYWKEQREILRKQYEKNKKNNDEKVKAKKKKVPKNTLEELDLYISKQQSQSDEEVVDYYEDVYP